MTLNPDLWKYPPKYGKPWFDELVDIQCEGYPVQPASYIVFKVNSDFCARDGLTGKLDYGGPNDAGGVDGADAQAVIQACLDAMTTGGLLFLKAALYVVDAVLEVDYDGITIQGEGPGQTIIKLADNVNPADGGSVNGRWSVIDAYEVDYVTVRDLTIDNNKANNTGGPNWANCIRFHGNPEGTPTVCSYCLVDNVEAKNGICSGVEFYFVESSVIKNVWAHHNGDGTTNQDGVRILYCTYCTIEHCRAHDNVYENYVIWESVRCEVDTILSYNSTSTGLVCDGISTGYSNPTTNSYYCEDITINNFFSHNDAGGIVLQESRRVAISNFMIRDGTSGEGIHLNGSSADHIKDVTISNGVIRENLQAGIRGSYADYVTVSNVISKNNGHDGVRLGYNATTCTYWNIQDCILYDDQGTPTQAYGINEITGDYNIFKNNDVRGNATGGMSISGSNTTVTGNKGFVTENNVLSGTFAIDSTGLKNVTINHGCDYTPNVQDVQATIVEDTDVDDWYACITKIKDITSSQLTVDVQVIDASATGGATAKVSIRVTRI